jgi:hypothetical protein
MLALTPGNQLAPWVGLGVFAAYAAAAIAVAALLLMRRDLYANDCTLTEVRRAAPRGAGRRGSRPRRATA